MGPSGKGLRGRRGGGEREGARRAHFLKEMRSEAEDRTLKFDNGGV